MSSPPSTPARLHLHSEPFRRPPRPTPTISPAKIVIRKSEPKKNEHLEARVYNIPAKFKIKDLRHFFGTAIEAECFLNFHYLEEDDHSCSQRAATTPTYQCLVCVHNEVALRSLQSYHETLWEKRTGEILDTFCLIAATPEHSAFPNSPSGLPQGNIGTPSRVIRQSVRSSLLPGSVLKLLGTNLRGKKKFPAPVVNLKPPVSDASSDEEEWDRWDRHNRPFSSKEKVYLYEDEIEKKWEKGGSGLVFYTDDFRWEGEKGDAEEKEIRLENDGWMVAGMSRDLELDNDAELHRMKSAIRRTSRSENYHRRVYSRKTALGTSSTAKRSLPYQIPRQSKRRAISASTNVYNNETDKMETSRTILRQMGWEEGHGLGADGNEGSLDPLIPTANPHNQGLGFQQDSKIAWRSHILDDLSQRFRAKSRIATHEPPS